MSDSINGFQTRGELYEKHKESHPALAKAYLGEKYHSYAKSSGMHAMGVMFLVAAVSLGIILIGIVD